MECITSSHPHVPAIAMLQIEYVVAVEDLLLWCTLNDRTRHDEVVRSADAVALRQVRVECFRPCELVLLGFVCLLRYPDWSCHRRLLPMLTRGLRGVPCCTGIALRSTSMPSFIA